MFSLIITFLIAIVLGFLAYILTKKIKDTKKRKVWRIILYSILALFVAGMVLEVLSFSKFFSSSMGRKEQKMWIQEELPKELWKQQASELCNTEYQRLSEVLEKYGNKAIQKYNDEGDEKDLDEYLAASLWGLDDLWLLGGGNSANEKKRKSQVEKYKKQYESVTQNLHDNMSLLMRLRDSSLTRRPAYSDEMVCASLLGTPEAIAYPSDELQLSIARSIVTNILYGREHPAVASSKYDKENKCWHVRMDNAPEQTVSFYKRDDGSYDAEWTGNHGYIPKQNIYDTEPIQGKSMQEESFSDTNTGEGFEKYPNPTIEMLYGTWHSYNAEDGFVEISITKEGVQRGQDIEYYESKGDKGYLDWGERFENGVVYGRGFDNLEIDEEGKIMIVDSDPELGYVYNSFFLDKSKEYIINADDKTTIFKKIH
jgi:ABC-type dipeptide/oligopeptide/nickel transport systems, permease components